MERFLPLVHDRIFKSLCYYKTNDKFLSKIIEKVTGLEVNYIVYKNTENNPDIKSNKNLRFDCLVDTNIGLIEIEMNSYYKNYLRFRNFIYAAKTYIDYYDIDKKYGDCKEIIQINFTNGLGDKYNKIEEYVLQTKSGKPFVKNFRIFEVNLDYYEKIWNNQDEEEIRKNYLYVLFNRNKEELKTLNDICEEAKEFCEMINDVNERPCSYYTIEEDELRIRNSIKAEAFDEGIETGKVEFIKKLIQKGLSFEEISELTDLSTDKIKELIAATK